jgi:hypothetical protein
MATATIPQSIYQPHSYLQMSADNTKPPHLVVRAENHFDPNVCSIQAAEDPKLIKSKCPFSLTPWAVRHPHIAYALIGCVALGVGFVGGKLIFKKR